MFHKMVASQAEPKPVAMQSMANAARSCCAASVRASEPATSHNMTAPRPVATPSQLAQSVALTSGWRLSQAELRMANAVQLTSETVTSTTPRQ